MNKGVLWVSCLGLLVGSAGCKSKDEGSGAAAPQVQLTPPPASHPVGATQPTDANHVVLTGSDQMQFDKKLISVKAGKKVTLELRHSGKLAATIMGHNFVLLKQGTSVSEFASQAIGAQATGYVPQSDQVIAHTKVIGGGESTTITFDAPPVGTYDFLCSFPGHSVLMQGKFVVE